MAEEAPAQETTPAEKTAETKQEKPDKSEHDQIGYLTRKQQEAEKQRDDVLAKLKEQEAKLKEFENAQLSEAERKDKEAKEARDKADVLERENARLKAVLDAKLPPELAELVPEGIEDPKGYIETKLKPLQEKFQIPGALGGPTQPDKTPVPTEADRLLKEWDAMMAQGVPEKQLEQFYNQNHAILSPALSRRGR